MVYNLNRVNLQAYSRRTIFFLQKASLFTLRLVYNIILKYGHIVDDQIVKYIINVLTET